MSSMDPQAAQEAANREDPSAGDALPVALPDTLPDALPDALPYDPELLISLKALASEPRLQILGWLKDPRAHFPEQVDGDLVEDGVCAVFLAEKLGVSAPTLHQHMAQLLRAKLVRSRKIKQWTFYRRNEARLGEIAKAIGETV